MGASIIKTFKVKRTGDFSFEFEMGLHSKSPSDGGLLIRDYSPIKIMVAFLQGYIALAENLEISARVQEATRVVNKQYEKDYEQLIAEFKEANTFGGYLFSISPYPLSKLRDLYAANEEGRLESYIQSLADKCPNEEVTRNLTLLHHEKMLADIERYGRMFYDIICPPRKINNK